LESHDCIGYVNWGISNRLYCCSDSKTSVAIQNVTSTSFAIKVMGSEEEYYDVTISRLHETIIVRSVNKTKNYVEVREKKSLIVNE